MKETAPPASRRLRRLSDDEIALWLTVTHSVTPRPGAVMPSLPKPAANAITKASTAAPVTTAPAPSPLPGLQRLAPLDRRLKQKLARGRLGVDAAIDLHGLNQQQAHAALHRFLLRAQANGAKLVLVVTGKGAGRSADEHSGGVLRRAVPHWLANTAWRSLIVGFDEAARPHGGAGALYVRLRRRDKTS